ncbi:MAG: rhodanese [Spartobacteria bacterium]|nr:rhodanese [Spartobacteria bacterium]
MNSGAIRQALLLVSLAFIPAIGHAVYYRDKVSWQGPVPPSQMVSLAKAQSWGAGAIWVDARPDEQFVKDHIPGAVPLNEDRWNELLPQFLAVWAPGKKTIVYCSNESCNLALEVATKLREEAQLKDIFVLEGGWEEWLKQKK